MLLPEIQDIGETENRYTLLLALRGQLAIFCENRTGTFTKAQSHVQDRCIGRAQQGQDVRVHGLERGGFFLQTELHELNSSPFPESAEIAITEPLLGMPMKLGNHVWTRQDWLCDHEIPFERVPVVRGR